MAGEAQHPCSREGEQCTGNFFQALGKRRAPGGLNCPSYILSMARTRTGRNVVKLGLRCRGGVLPLWGALAVLQKGLSPTDAGGYVPCPLQQCDLGKDAEP